MIAFEMKCSFVSPLHTKLVTGLLERTIAFSLRRVWLEFKEASGLLASAFQM